MTDERPASDSAAPGGPERRPGEELRRARERAGIERETIASRLRLRMPQFEALESDDYAELPPPTFVRGYIRIYARELGLDPEDLIGLYDAGIAEQAEPEIRPGRGEGSASTGRGAMIGLLLILLVVGGGAGAWYYQHRMQDTVSADDGAAGESASGTSAAAPSDDATATGQSGDDGGNSGRSGADDAGAAPATGSGDAADDTVAEAEPAATEAPTAEAAGGDAAAASDDEADEAAASGDDAPATTAGDGAAESGAASAPGEATATATRPETGVEADAGDTGTEADTGDIGTEAEAGDAGAEAGAADEAAPESPGAETPRATDVAAAATTDAAATGPDRLVLEFADRSWIQVSDDRERTLVYTLYYGTDPLEVRGWAPFDILLGNSPGVRIRFNGEPIDKSRFTRSDNTARFLVDESGARRR